MDDNPLYSDLVLIGGGHAHIHLLKMLGMPMKEGGYKELVSGIRLTLITRDVLTPYSGMLPGYVSGHYTYSDVHIDLSNLCSFSGFRLINASAVGVTMEEGGKGNGWVKVNDGRPDVRFDVLSIDIGSSPMSVTQGSHLTTPVKPIDEFGLVWSSLVRRAEKYGKEGGEEEGKVFEVAVVGGGAGGVELALSVQHRLRDIRDDVGVTIVARGDIMSSHNDKVREVFRRILEERGVTVVKYAEATAVTPHPSSPGLKHLHVKSSSSDGRESYPIDKGFNEVLWCTSATTQGWIKDNTPLVTTEGGFVKVNEFYQTSVPTIFAAGDCASNPSNPRPKAGVFAVRAGPFIRQNLINTLLGKELVPHEPQKEFLGIISTGDKYAVASRGEGGCLEGKWAWKLKDEIDTTWMKGYKELPEMEDETSPPPIVMSKGAAAMAAFAEAPMRCGGCGAKVGSSVLARVLKKVRERREIKEGGTGGGNSVVDMDDCAVCPPPPPGSMLVHTIDFFRSFISDPFIFGRISAIHALSDCHAMGAVPQTALALAVAPFADNESITEDTLVAMLSGANDALMEDRCSLVGGHTCEGKELSLGFAVNGYLPKSFRPITKKGGEPGDFIILTKRIGTGALFASEMRGKCKGTHRAEAIKSMCLSNGIAGRLITETKYQVKAATDVTGFGLMGHIIEMLGDGVGAELDIRKIPFFDGALDAARQDIFSSLQNSNESARRTVRNHASATREFPLHSKLLYDPQTSGGLIIVVGGEDEGGILEELKKDYPDACVIGKIVHENEVGGGGGSQEAFADGTCRIEKLVKIAL